MASERDLFANFDRMRREIDELFGDVFDRASLGGGRRQFSPHVDVYYCGQPPRAIVKVELAGIEVDDVGLEIRGRRLVVELGADVVADAATASYDDGILRVEIPIAAPDDERRQVPIRGREPSE